MSCVLSLGLYHSISGTAKGYSCPEVCFWTLWGLRSVSVLSSVGFLSLCKVVADLTYLSDFTWPRFWGMTRAHLQHPEWLSLASPPREHMNSFSSRGRPDRAGQAGSRATSLSQNPRHREGGTWSKQAFCLLICSGNGSVVYLKVQRTWVSHRVNFPTQDFCSFLGV